MQLKLTILGHKKDLYWKCVDSVEYNIDDVGRNLITNSIIRPVGLAEIHKDKVAYKIRWSFDYDISCN